MRTQRLSTCLIVLYLLVSSGARATSIPDGIIPGDSGSTGKTTIDPAPSTVGDDYFTTDHVITEGVETILDPGSKCLGYCVVGICTRLSIKLIPPSAKIILTPKIEHNTPDFLVSTYDQTGEEPWYEWRETFAKAEGELQKTIIDLMIDTVIGGGQNIDSETAKHEDVATLRFKEVDIHGHPLTLLINMLAGNNSDNASSYGSTVGLDPSDIATCAVYGGKNCGTTNNNKDKPKCTDDLEACAKETLLKFGSPEFLVGFFGNDMLTDAMGYYNMAKDLKKIYGSMKDMQKMISDIQSFVDFGFGAEFAVDRYFCPTQVTPIVPYYLSQMDTHWWRELVPFTTDMLLMLDPQGMAKMGCAVISLDGVTGGLKILPSLDGDDFDNDCVVGANELSMWGTVYPRTGFVIHSNDLKASSVMAERAMDVLLDNQEVYRTRMPLTRTGRNGIWQPLYPEPGTCTASRKAREGGYSAMYTEAEHISLSSLQQMAGAIRDWKLDEVKELAEDPDPSENPLNWVELDGQGVPIKPKRNPAYSWVYWRPYSCCLSTRGRKILDVSTPDMCI